MIAVCAQQVLSVSMVRLFHYFANPASIVLMEQSQPPAQKVLIMPFMDVCRQMTVYLAHRDSFVIKLESLITQIINVLQVTFAKLKH